jgi:TldD protein
MPGDDPEFKALAARAIDAATRVGATYVDVRFRQTEQELWDLTEGTGYGPPWNGLATGVGVRALFRGYWGYASHSGAVDADQIARLGREAAVQAVIGAKGLSRTVELASTPVVSNGVWSTPIGIDPFTVSWDEKIDAFAAMARYFGSRQRGLRLRYSKHFVKDMQAFMSSEGSSYAQTLYSSRAGLTALMDQDWRTGRDAQMTVTLLSVAGAGWEYIVNAPYEETLDQTIGHLKQLRRARPLDVGRYDVVFDSVALAHLIDDTLGATTELSRAMGYSANSVGTSYLNDPLAMLGTYHVGSPLLNVTADRSMRGGAATVKWDDEGVEPDNVALVTQGILTDFQTTRESASWLAPYYRQRGTSVRSHGGALCGRVNHAPMQTSANLTLAPSAQRHSFDDLVAGTKRGLAVLGGYCLADQQGLNAECNGSIVYEITNGKLGGAVAGGLLWVRAPEFWKNLVALGDAATVRHTGIERQLDWDQVMTHTISAPAAKVTGVAVVNDVIQSLR